MFELIFTYLSDFGNKHTFLKDNLFWKLIRKYYWKLRVFTYPNTSDLDANAIQYFENNKDRISKVANLLYDRQSKEEYLGMIKFRQTHSKQDFPNIISNKDETYFIKEIVLNKEEVFIDCGAYTGDTIDAFLKNCQNYKHIISLEPDTVNFQKLVKKHGNNSKITLINAGVYDSEGVVSFQGQGLDGAVVVEKPKQKDSNQAIFNQIVSNQVEINVIKIDNLQLEKVSFIKMDIEGAELNALKGAENTIKRDKPKLAISIYHKNEDMVDIAEYLNSIMPKYKMYVRQHMPLPYWVETVLYAV